MNFGQTGNFVYNCRNRVFVEAKLGWDKTTNPWTIVYFLRKRTIFFKKICERKMAISWGGATKLYKSGDFFLEDNRLIKHLNFSFSEVYPDPLPSEIFGNHSIRSKIRWEKKSNKLFYIWTGITNNRQPISGIVEYKDGYIQDNYIFTDFRIADAVVNDAGNLISAGFQYRYDDEGVSDPDFSSTFRVYQNKTIVFEQPAEHIYVKNPYEDYLLQAKITPQDILYGYGYKEDNYSVMQKTTSGFSLLTECLWDPITERWIGFSPTIRTNYAVKYRTPVFDRATIIILPSSTTIPFVWRDFGGFPYHSYTSTYPLDENYFLVHLDLLHELLVFSYEGDFIGRTNHIFFSNFDILRAVDWDETDCLPWTFWCELQEKDIKEMESKVFADRRHAAWQSNTE